MTLERGIALAVFAVGAAVVVLALVGCGGEGDESPETACESRDFALPVVGERLIDDGSAVRFAYAGGEPCFFAVDRHEGRLYVELRSAADPDRKPPFPSGCAEGGLDFTVRAGTPLERVYGAHRLLDDAETERLLTGNTECVALPEGSPAFVID